MSTEKEVTISVVIPAYNVEKYIARAIDSVLAQSRPPLEIIVVDDGSTDDTGRIVQGYGAKVRYIRQENAGASAARNTGIAEAKNRWIALLDGDDEWFAGKLAEQAALLDRNPHLHWTTANFYRCRCREGDRRVIDTEEKRATELLGGREYFDDFCQAYMAHCSGWTGTMVIRKDVFEATGGFRMGQFRNNDEDMWLRIAYRFPAVGYTVRPLAVYHSQVARSITKIHLDPMMICDFVERHWKLAEEQGRLEAFQPVAAKLARMWIHRCWEDERIYAVPQMLRRLRPYLPWWYRTAVRALVVRPGLALKCMPALRKLNKLLKIPI